MAKQEVVYFASIDQDVAIRIKGSSEQIAKLRDHMAKKGVPEVQKPEYQSVLRALRLKWN